MSSLTKTYHAEVRSALVKSICLLNFNSQQVERHNKPLVESNEDPEGLLPPITVTKNEQEKVLIEPSFNSCRVSIKIKQADELEHLLTSKFTRFLMLRAENFAILRRKPIPVTLAN